MTPTDPARYRSILQQTWPIILANSATPLLGLVDTAIIGHHADTTHLGAVALGALLFNFLYWGFGFLRMSTTGFIAQASGRNDPDEVMAVFCRALLMGIGIGLALWVLQRPLLHAALPLLGGSAEVEVITADYFSVRIWGAPATLALYACMGYFIGQGLSRWLLLVQVFLNGLNMLLDGWFAGHLQQGAAGIALGTAIAEWVTLLLALWIIQRHRQQQWPSATLLRHELLGWHKLKPLLSANGNLMVRTLFLLLGFAVFTDQGARSGDAVLAANHVLLQFISFSAFFLDGFAYTCESMAGRALGQGQRALFWMAVRRTTELAAATALLLAGSLYIGGDTLINLLTNDATVRTLASTYLPLCCLYIALSFAAFQLDGLFIGTTTTAPLRNASILSTLGFLLACYGLIPLLGNTGLWWAFVGFVVLRAVCLGAGIHHITQRLSIQPQSAQSNT